MTVADRRDPRRTQPSREVLALRSLHQLATTVNSAEALEDVLDAVTRGVVEVLGFRMAAVNVLDSLGWLEVLSVAGDESAREAMLARRIPLDEYLEEFELADEWGLLKFVPHDRLPADVQSTWVPSVRPLDHPDAWHPLDALYAPLRGPGGHLLGVLGVDLPEDGMRPGPLKRQVLEMYAVQAGLAIHQAQDRARLRERIRLARTTREVVDRASRELDLAHVLEESRPALRSGFACDDLWICATGSDPEAGPTLLDREDLSAVPRAELEPLARRLWAEQRIQADDGLLVAPLGAGPDCLGALVMQRAPGRAPWSEPECEAARLVGQELGQAVANARRYARERSLVAELQELDRYKGELIGTITHELKNPLSSILGHLELLEDADVAPRNVGPIRRNVDRLQTLAEDLLVLASVRDPGRAYRPAEVDLSALVAEVLDDLAVLTRQREVSVAAAPEPGLLVPGEPEELRRLVTNLVSNAVKYSPAGGRIEVTLEAAADAVLLRCSDTGIGIAEDDLPTLFDEFDRSSNPAARARAGTGLGLAIVRRIADRHGATIEVASELGVGSTFTVALPRSVVAR